MPRAAASCAVGACFLIASALAANISAVPVGPPRPTPVTGFGTEFVFETYNDTSLNANLALGGSRMCRYPGGTPSDYWLWDLGWVNVTSDHSGSSKLPFRPTTPAALHDFLANSSQPTCVMVLNQLQTTLEYQLAGLAAHAAAGTPVTHVELGNEMYDATRPDVLAAYPQPSDYAQKMSAWTPAIQAAFPGVKVALDGVANTWDARTEAWNTQVLQNPVSSAADAATVHLYPGLPAELPTPATYAPLLALAFSTVDGYSSYVTASIPARMEVWVTEWGTWGNANITGTWLQGLWHGALLGLLLPSIPRVSVVLPYCATCADPNMPSFVSQYGPIAPVNATNTLWSRTPSGHVYSVIFSTVTSIADSMTGLAFSPNPQLDPSVPDSRQFVGFLGLRGGAARSALVLNLCADSASLALAGLGFGSCGAAMSSGSDNDVSYVSFWAAGTEVARQGIAVWQLQNATGTASSATGDVPLPGYSVTTLTCVL